MPCVVPLMVAEMVDPYASDAQREHYGDLIRIHEWMGNKTAARIARAQWQKLYSWQRAHGRKQL